MTDVWKAFLRKYDRVYDVAANERALQEQLRRIAQRAPSPTVLPLRPEFDRSPCDV